MYVSLNSFQPCDLPSLLSSLQPIAPLLDTLTDVVFFIKDTQARYAFVNQTLARRCGRKHREELLGLTAEQEIRLSVRHIRPLLVAFTGIPDDTIRRIHFRDVNGLAEKLAPLLEGLAT